MEGKGSFEEWLKEVVTKHETAKASMAEADRLAQEKGVNNLSVSETATLRRAVRELSEAGTVLDIALQVQKLLELPFAEGAVTIHIPELGLFTQFSWGDYDLLASLKKTLSKQS